MWRNCPLRETISTAARLSAHVFGDSARTYDGFGPTDNARVGGVLRAQIGSAVELRSPGVDGGTSRKDCHGRD